jgi:hypothetical protein
MRGAYQLLRDIWIPIVFTMSLALWSITKYKLGEGLWMPHAVLVFALRVAAIGAAGFLATYRADRKVWVSAVSGAIVFFAEQILVNAAFFIVDAQPQSALKVTESFFPVVWVACIVATLGGLGGRALRNRKNTVT